MTPPYAEFEAEMERHQAEVIEALMKDNPDKVKQLREKPWNAGWFVGKVLQRMGKHTDISGAWSEVLRRAFAD